MSPTTKTRGGRRVRSGFTPIRPPGRAAHRLVGEHLAERAGLDARGPHLRDRVDAPSGAVLVLHLGPRSSTSTTMAPSGPRLEVLERALGLLAELGPERRQPAAAASSRMTRAARVLMRRKSCLSVRWAVPAIWPAISTPVGPAPTTTKVSSRSISSSSSAISASSNAPKMRPRRFRARRRWTSCPARTRRTGRCRSRTARHRPRRSGSRTASRSPGGARGR